MEHSNTLTFDELKYNIHETPEKLDLKKLLIPKPT